MHPGGVLEFVGLLGEVRLLGQRRLPELLGPAIGALVAQVHQAGARRAGPRRHVVERARVDGELVDADLRHRGHRVAGGRAAAGLEVDHPQLALRRPLEAVDGAAQRDGRAVDLDLGPDRHLHPD